jgi:hypothetical protein
MNSAAAPDEPSRTVFKPFIITHVTNILKEITANLNESAGLPSFLSLRMNKRTYFSNIIPDFSAKLYNLTEDNLYSITFALKDGIKLFREKLDIMKSGPPTDSDLNELVNIIRFNMPTGRPSYASKPPIPDPSAMPEWSFSDMVLYRATIGKPPIASGGYGKVYKVKRGDEYVAVKVITPKDYKNVADAEQEAFSLFSLKDQDPPIFPKFIAYGKFNINSEAPNPTCVIIMELINGIELYDYFWLKNYDAYPTNADRNALGWKKRANPEFYAPFESLSVDDVLTAVKNKIEQLHNAGYVHRDIKPDNIMLTMKNGELQVYLIDAGFTVPINSKTDSYVGARKYNPYMTEDKDAEHTEFISKLYDKNIATPSLNAFAFNKTVKIFDSTIRMPYTGGKRVRRKTTRSKRSMQRSTRRSMQRSTRRSMQRKAQ